MPSTQPDNALDEPTLGFTPAETDGDNLLVMEQGGGGPDQQPAKPRGGRGRVHHRKEWTCEPDFQMSQGVTPHNVQIDPLDEWNLPWQPYDPKDEIEFDKEDYSDLIPPPNWPY